MNLKDPERIPRLNLNDPEQIQRLDLNDPESIPIQRKTVQQRLQAKQSSNLGLILGIVIGTLFVIFFAGLGIYFVYKNQKQTTSIVVDSNETNLPRPATKQTYYYVVQPGAKGTTDKSYATTQDIRNVKSPDILTEKDYIDRLYASLQNEKSKTN